MNRTQRANRCILYFMLCFFCANAMSQQKEDAVHNVQKLLENVAERSDIAWLIISCFPFDVHTFTAVMPEELDKSGRIYNIQKERPDLQSLIPALRHTKLKSGGITEVRLAVTLYDAEKTRLLSIYMSPFGSRGYINSTPIEFEETSGDIYDWLHENFIGCFESKVDYYKDRQARILEKQNRIKTQE